MTSTRTWTLSSGTPAAITIGGDVISADSAGAYVLDPENLLSVGGASYAMDGIVYAVKTDTAGRAVLVAVATRTDGNSDIAQSTSESSAQSGSFAPATSTMTSTSTSTASRRVLDLRLFVMAMMFAL
ncbi:hypothetical protein AC578_9321 [Pseudocercospora eumusae]|uniref:Uncharacterized protein n=1 Tax=Pseudocercospora eumusae TaxID=321146 RepID=A0A139HNG7_9PEZI|nr:hypothetical protein AC578_9321 [Pseudocercospora eumusae]